MKSRGLEYGVINALREASCASHVVGFVLLPAGGHEPLPPPRQLDVVNVTSYKLLTNKEVDAEGSVSDAAHAAHAVLLLTASRPSPTGMLQLYQVSLACIVVQGAFRTNEIGPGLQRACQG